MGFCFALKLLSSLKFFCIMEIFLFFKEYWVLLLKSMACCSIYFFKFVKDYKKLYDSGVEEFLSGKDFY